MLYSFPNCSLVFDDQLASCIESPTLSFVCRSRIFRFRGGFQESSGLMDPLSEPANVVAFTLWLLFLVLNTPEAPAIPELLESADDGEDSLRVIAESVHSTFTEAQNQLSSTLLQFRLCTAYNFLDEDLGFWVKPRSTTWFSRFLLEQYDNSRWVQMFRMTKPAVLALADVLRPQVQKENTKYRLAIPVLIRVACTLFKLTHGANTTVCSELFAIGRSTVLVVLRDVVNAINVSLRHELVWPTGERLRDIESKFYQLCGLPGVVGAIDGTHIAISSPITYRQITTISKVVDTP